MLKNCIKIICIILILISLFFVFNKSEGKEIIDLREEYCIAKIEENILIEDLEIVPEILKSKSGDDYSLIGTIKIEKINLEMQISSKTTEELMRKYACRLWGPDVNKEGNLCIIGHNWRNKKLFSKVPRLEIGDEIELIDLKNKSKIYTIYEKYVVDPENTEPLNQETNGQEIITLITCTNDSKNRYIFHAK